MLRIGDVPGHIAALDWGGLGTFVSVPLFAVSDAFQAPPDEVLPG